MDQIYKADPKTNPNVTDKINIKTSVMQMSLTAKLFQTKMLNLKLKNVASGKSLSIDALSKDLDRNDDLLVAPLNDLQMLKSKPSLFRKPDFHPKLNESLQLKSVEAAKFRYDMINLRRRRKRNPGKFINQPTAQIVHSKYQGVRWLEDGMGEGPSTQNCPNLSPNEDCSVYIRVYHPFKHVKGLRLGSRPKLCQEVVMYGKQTLVQLRILIMCNEDVAVNKDMSENPREPILERAFDVCKSGFIFINNVFYNDSSDPNNIDYSAVIREWATENGIGEMTTASMENTCLEDLTIQLGYPYIYQHQGDCEHIIVFSDIRLIGNDDALQSKNYPYVRFIPQRRARLCMVCGKFIVKWVTEGSDRVPVDPCYFCEGCFFSFNYIDGKKVGQFKAFPYVDRSVLI